MMGFSQYQEACKHTARENLDLNYIDRSIAGEAGEITEMFKKYLYHNTRDFRGRDDTGPVDFLTALQLEFGDVLWALANGCNYFGWSLKEIAEMNIEKLKKRYP